MRISGAQVSFPPPLPSLLHMSTHALFLRVRIYLIRAESSGPEEGVSSAPLLHLLLLLLLSIPHPFSRFPSHTFPSQSPRAKTLMKTNARNQFAASSFHLAGARLCTSISTAAGGELLQSSPITHTSVSPSSYRLRALLRDRCIKMGRLCFLKLSSQNLFFFRTQG